LKKIINVKELEQQARPHLTKMAYDFIAGGADDEVTLRQNEKSWEKLKLLPRVLRGPDRELNLKTTLLGQAVDFPIVVAPMGFQCLAHPEGEVAGAQGAAMAGTIFALSTTSTRSIEDVAHGSDGPKWFQLYVYKDRAITENLVERAVRSGYKAICLTVDTIIEGRRERDKYNQFRLPPGLSVANFKNQPALKNIGGAEDESALTTYIENQWEAGLSWADVDWVASLSQLPLIIKGILAVPDAELAVQHGAAAIVVSNHGGRQLDGVPATADVLPAIVAAVGNQCEVLVDGGLRRGTHILKALALGARAVLVGRPVFWGLALNGADGVQAVLYHLRDELKASMELVGWHSVHDVSRDLIWNGQLNGPVEMIE
jgi:4-hydroxymandelate oxidase